jgi:rare lipoprotein A
MSTRCLVSVPVCDHPIAATGPTPTAERRTNTGLRVRPVALALPLVLMLWTGCASSGSGSRSGSAASSGRSSADFYGTPSSSTPSNSSRGTGTILRGKATYYGAKYQGRTTASGERFDKNGFTAAHQSISFGTRVRVTNVENGRSVVVRVNDRFKPFDGRIIDLSEVAFAQIAPLARGVVPVTVEILR